MQIKPLLLLLLLLLLNRLPVNLLIDVYSSNCKSGI